MFSKTRQKAAAGFLLILFAVLMLPGLWLAAPHLAATLGISAYASKKIIDILAAAGTVWSVIGIIAAIAGGGAIGAGILAVAKSMIKKYGAAAASAW